MRTRVILATILLALSFSAPDAGAQTEFMPVDSIKRGMTGIVRTTLQGTRVEELSAEVLGVIRNSLGPGKHIVLVRLTDDRVREQGVANGMSGSPFFIDGKLVGALSTRIGFFSKEPIAGVTPIGDMLATQLGGRGHPTGSVDFRRVWGSYPGIKRISSLLGMPLPEKSSGVEPFQQLAELKPFAVTLSHGGIDPVVIKRFAPLLADVGLMLSASGTVGRSDINIEGTLEPGMPVMVELVGGDLSLGASGTVTYIEGDKLWAFGHPFFQLGDVTFPMSRAELIEVFPSIQSSFNITNTGQTIGSIIQDRSSAVFGILGREADTIPMSVEVKHGGDTVASYNYRLARDVLLTPILINLALSNSMMATQRQSGELSVALQGTISIDGHEDIRIDDLFSGFSVHPQAAALPAAVYFFLVNNEFQPVSVTAINLVVDFLEEQRSATLERAWLTKSEVKPGGRFQLVMEIAPRRGRRFTLTRDYFIPSSFQRGEYHITVGNGATMARQEGKLFEGTLTLRDIDHLIRLINTLRPNYKLYSMTFREEEGVYYRGDFFPGMPPSTLSVIKSHNGDSSFVRLKATVLDERQIDTEYLVSGAVHLSFTVTR